MSTWFEVAPLQRRSTVSTPLTLRPAALSVICGGGVGVTVAVAVGVAVGVNVAVAVAVGVGVTVDVGVGVGEPACAQYLPPVLKRMAPLEPPQTIISLPVHTAV